MKRLGVFVFYDAQGVVDDYVTFLLAQMKQVCCEIVAICNGNLTIAGSQRLKQFCANVYQRDNTGMDAGALKDYFTGLSAKEYWSSFDELVWFNDTCYGPIYKIEDCFNEMAIRGSFDFWGMTVHARSNTMWPGRKEPGIPEHLQSYFIVVKKHLLKDLRFLQFWEELQVSNGFNATVADYELTITQRFASWGYTYGVYCDTRPLDTNPDSVCNHTADNTYSLVTAYHCPFIKRKNFIRTKAESLVHSNGELVQRTMQFIEENHLYPTEMIYRNLMRLYDQRLWNQNLCHTYYLEKNRVNYGGETHSAMILAEANHTDTVKELAQFLAFLPPKCSAVIITHSEKVVAQVKQLLPNVAVRLCPARHTGLLFLLLEARELPWHKNDYLCFLPEHWGNPANAFHLTESSQRHCTYENLISGSSFIKNIQSVFLNNPCLGILAPISTYWGASEGTGLGDQWSKVKEFAEQFGSIVPKDESSVPVACAGAFWCRKEAVSPIFRVDENQLKCVDNETIEKAISYIAQSAGYYSGTIAETQQAALAWTNRQWIVTKELYSNRDFGIDSLRMIGYQAVFHDIAMVKTGRMKIEETWLTLPIMRKVLCLTAGYYLQKLLLRPIRIQKKETFFLGFRDVWHVYQKMKREAHS